MVIQATLAAAVQAHPVGAATATVPVAPLPATDALAGVKAYVQPPRDCVTVTVCPAIVRVPVRGVVPVLTPTV